MTMESKIRPIQDRIVVKRDEAEAVRASGIHMPGTSQDKPRKGTVVAVGKGQRLADGTLLPLEIAVDDRVIFGSYAGTEVEVDGEVYTIMREGDVVGIIIGSDSSVAPGTSPSRRSSAHPQYQ